VKFHHDYVETEENIHCGCGHPDIGDRLETIQKSKRHRKTQDWRHQPETHQRAQEIHRSGRYIHVRTESKRLH